VLQNVTCLNVKEPQTVLGDWIVLFVVQKEYVKECWWQFLVKSCSCVWVHRSEGFVFKTFRWSRRLELVTLGDDSNCCLSSLSFWSHWSTQCLLQFRIHSFLLPLGLQIPTGSVDTVPGHLLTICFSIPSRNILFSVLSKSKKNIFFNSSLESYD
jgi:hypothetical protein